MRPSQALNSRRGPHLTQISENPGSAGILPALLRTSPTLSPRRRADLAPAAPKDATPPVEQASFHQLVFANENVAVLNNLYPPGGDSGFHAHHRDLFAVIIQPQPSSSQTPGKPLKPAAEVQAGTAAYSPVSGEPRVHRVINNGQGPFHERYGVGHKLLQIIMSPYLNGDRPQYFNMTPKHFRHFPLFETKER